MCHLPALILVITSILLHMTRSRGSGWPFADTFRPSAAFSHQLGLQSTNERLLLRLWSLVLVEANVSHCYGLDYVHKWQSGISADGAALHSFVVIMCSHVSDTWKSISLAVSPKKMCRKLDMLPSSRDHPQSIRERSRKTTRTHSYVGVTLGLQWPVAITEPPSRAIEQSTVPPTYFWPLTALEKVAEPPSSSIGNVKHAVTYSPTPAERCRWRQVLLPLPSAASKIQPLIAFTRNESTFRWVKRHYGDQSAFWRSPLPLALTQRLPHVVVRYLHSCFKFSRFLASFCLVI